MEDQNSLSTLVMLASINLCTRKVCARSNQHRVDIQAQIRNGATHVALTDLTNARVTYELVVAAMSSIAHQHSRTISIACSRTFAFGRCSLSLSGRHRKERFIGKRERDWLKQVERTRGTRSLSRRPNERATGCNQWESKLLLLQLNTTSLNSDRSK